MTRMSIFEKEHFSNVPKMTFLLCENDTITFFSYVLWYVIINIDFYVGVSAVGWVSSLHQCPKMWHAKRGQVRVYRILCSIGPIHSVFLAGGRLCITRNVYGPYIKRTRSKKNRMVRNFDPNTTFQFKSCGLVPFGLGMQDMTTASGAISSVF